MIRITLSILAVATIALAGCAGEKQQPLPSEARLLVACDSLTQQFMGELKGELMSALSSGSAAEAISVCKVTAPEVAAKYSETPGWEIKRVSTKTRNPGNKPSKEEAALLARLSGDDARGDVFQWVHNESGDSTFYYVKAIRLQQPCLMCHGDKAYFEPELVQTLETEYPEDQATGFQVGDLRGAFVVKVDYPEGAVALMRPAETY